MAATAIGLGTELRFLLAATMMLVVGVTGWLAMGLGRRAEPILWSRSHQSAFAPSHPDGRVRLLRARLVSEPSRRKVREDGERFRFDPADAILSSLIDVIDDHLRHEHDIDRAVDPKAAAGVLGPELTRFVTDPAAGQSMIRRHTLASTLTRIENLCSSAPTDIAMKEGT